MTAFLGFTITGLVTGCVYALSATGLVVTYTTSGVFNFAHGAIGMIAAFVYWQLTVWLGWPVVLGLLVVLVLLAPLMGAFIERTLIRPLHGKPVDVPLVVTLGLLLALLGVANIAWKPTVTRVVEPFFHGRTVRVLGVGVTYHQLVVVGVAVAAAMVLRLLFTRTRTGIAMRAVVDNPVLVGRTGASPARIRQLSWAIGAVMAALSGILLSVPPYRLDSLLLTLLVINGYAAAAVGRLKSLPLTVVGALVLGLAITYAVGYLPIGGLLSEFQLAIPMILLFVVLIVLRHDPLRVGAATAPPPPAPPTIGSAVGWAGAVVAGTIVASLFLGPADLATASTVFVMAIILLSLVVLTGFSGMASLCQMTFVGLGAFAMGHLGAGGSIVGALAAVGLAAAAGALVALPTLKLRGLWLALATLAFAHAMDSIFFVRAFVSEGGFDIARLHLPGFSSDSDRGYLILLAVLFAVASMGVVAVRRGRFGRRLAALNDSPAACATLGLNINWTKLVVFAASAGLAGLGGALFGGLRGTASNNEFVMLNSLVLLLLLRIGGVSTVTGAFFGAFIFALFPVLQSHFPQLSNLRYLLTGLAAVSVGRDPNGIGGRVGHAAMALRARREARRAVATPVAALEAPSAPAAEPARLSVRAARSPETSSPTETSPLLEVRSVSVRFGGVQALLDVDFEAEAGGITGLIGPNGAGKTTLFNVICGFERPTRGTVRVNGIDVRGLSTHRRARLGVARTFQRLEVFSSLTARDNIRAAAEFRRGWARDDTDVGARTEQIIDLVGLRAVADAPMDALPTGLARLVELGRALATGPRLLLLDEPGSGLDLDETASLARVLAGLRSTGIAIVLVEHDMRLVMQVCDRISVLDFGRVIARGTPAEVRSDPRVQAAYLGDEPLTEVVA